MVCSRLRGWCLYSGFKIGKFGFRGFFRDFFIVRFFKEVDVGWERIMRGSSFFNYIVREVVSIVYLFYGWGLARSFDLFRLRYEGVGLDNFRF